MKQLKQFFYAPILLSILTAALLLSLSDNAFAASKDNKEDYKLTNQGAALYKEKKYPQAIETLSRQLKLTPRDWITVSWRAAAYIDSGQYEAGLKDLELLIKLEPESQHSTTYGWYGDVCRSMGDFKKAKQALKKALHYKESALNHVRLGEIYMQEGDLDKAIDEFTTALNHKAFLEIKRIYGINWPAYVYSERGECYLKKDMNDAAYNDAKMTVELMPRYKQILKNGKDVPLFFDKKQRSVLAENALTQAQKEQSNGQSEEAFNQLRLAYGWAPFHSELEDKITAEMLKVYPQLKTKPALPEDARRLFIQAENLAGQKEYIKALDNYETLLQICPWHPETYFNSALLRAETKNYAKAVENMKKYLLLVPEASDARAAQDKIYEWELNK